jgi:hypothetical protein
MRHAMGANNTFQLYVHRNGERFVGLCTELKEVIEGATAEEILVKAKALLDSVPRFAGRQRPRISLRVSPSLQEAAHAG